MNNASPFESARVYLGAQLSSETFNSASPSSHPGGPYVTISREAGAGGSTLAQMLAEHLNATPRTGRDPDAPVWTLFDQNLVERMLQEQHLSPRLAQFLPEAKISEITSLVREIVGLHPNLWMLVKKTNLLMRELARRGHAILVGRGASFATAGISRGLRIRLVGPPEFRAIQTARMENIPLADAFALNRKTDADRRKYVRSTFNADVTRPESYDMVLNTARVSFAETVAMAAPLLRARAAAPGVTMARV